MNRPGVVVVCVFVNRSLRIVVFDNILQREVDDFLIVPPLKTVDSTLIMDVDRLAARKKIYHSTSMFGINAANYHLKRYRIYSFDLLLRSSLLPYIHIYICVRKMQTGLPTLSQSEVCLSCEPTRKSIREDIKPQIQIFPTSRFRKINNIQAQSHSIEEAWSLTFIFKELKASLCKTLKPPWMRSFLGRLLLSASANDPTNAYVTIDSTSNLRFETSENNDKIFTIVRISVCCVSQSDH